MPLQKPDRHFRNRYIIRNAVMSVPAVVALVLSWRYWGQFGLSFWLAAGFFLSWIIGWIILDVVLFRSYRCPSCGQRITTPTIQNRKADDPIHYYCPRCDTEWDTGLREPGVQG
jgi:predicted RNA-binding Zn-ribbon protein involved in translation (DUF1610 family)